MKAITNRGEWSLINLFQKKTQLCQVCAIVIIWRFKLLLYVKCLLSLGQPVSMQISLHLWIYVVCLFIRHNLINLKANIAELDQTTRMSQPIQIYSVCRWDKGHITCSNCFWRFKIILTYIAKSYFIRIWTVTQYNEASFDINQSLD